MLNTGLTPPLVLTGRFFIPSSTIDIKIKGDFRHTKEYWGKKTKKPHQERVECTRTTQTLLAQSVGGVKVSQPVLITVNDKAVLRKSVRPRES